MRLTPWFVSLFILFLAPAFGAEEQAKPPRFKIVEVRTSCCGHHGPGHHHGPGSHHHNAPIEFDASSILPLDAPTTQQDLDERQVALSALDAFHNAIEGEHEHNQGVQNFLRSLTRGATWKKWASNLNVRQLGINTYRAYKIKSVDSTFRSDALNLVFILPFTHLLEMASGPIASTVAAQFGATDAVTYGLGALGGIISIPGIDPLCILVYTTYPIPAVRRSITMLRSGTTRVLGFAGQITGVQSLYKQLIEFQSPVETLVQDSERRRLTESQKFYSIVSDSNFKLIEKSTEKTWLEFDIEKMVLDSKLENSFQAERSYVQNLRLSPEALLPQNRRTLQRGLAGLHWNVREAVMQNILDIERGVAPRFYLESREHGVDGAQFTFTRNGVPLPGRTRFCNRLLQKP